MTLKPRIALHVSAGIGMALLSGCVTPDPAGAPQPTAPQIGACFATTTAPAIAQTVTEQMMVEPASTNADGSVQNPAIFRTVTRQNMVEGPQVQFEIPCDDVLTVDFISSVQRALNARGYYEGDITGTFDAMTTAAILQFQIDQNDVRSGILTLRTARALGLVEVPRDQL